MIENKAYIKVVNNKLFENIIWQPYGQLILTDQKHSLIFIWYFYLVGWLGGNNAAYVPLFSEYRVPK